MPHKRAKRSIREAETARKGFNLAPSSSDRDDTPRSASRIFNAYKVQTQFRATGRVNSEDTGERVKGKGKRPLERDDNEPAAKKSAAKGKGKAGTEIPKINPHESLGDYNRRVEALLRPGVSKAIKSAETVRGAQVRAAKEAKEARKAAASGKPAVTTAAASSSTMVSDSPPPPDKPVKEFASLPTRKRLNDVAEAPPQLIRMRQAKDSSGGGSAWGATGRTPLSAAQKRILETERERVVGLYRDMKAKKEAEREIERAEAAKGKGKSKVAGGF